MLTQASRGFEHRFPPQRHEAAPDHSGNIFGRNVPRREANGDIPVVTMHVVSSLDGFIARTDNTVSWLDSPADSYPAGVAEDAPEGFLQAIDCYLLGSRTYEHALQLGWPYGETPTVVLTSRQLPSPRKNVEFYSGDLKRLVDLILAPRYRNIWLVGGAMVCQSFLKLGLVDVIRLSLAPVLLGQGLRLFESPSEERRWNLRDVVAYNTGFVELVYARQPASSEPAAPER
jgi:dihydrofolate reductase